MAKIEYHLSANHKKLVYNNHSKKIKQQRIVLMDETNRGNMLYLYKYIQVQRVHSAGADEYTYSTLDKTSKGRLWGGEGRGQGGVK